jgi:hypothetical protein
MGVNTEGGIRRPVSRLLADMVNRNPIIQTVGDVAMPDFMKLVVSNPGRVLPFPPSTVNTRDRERFL